MKPTDNIAKNLRIDRLTIYIMFFLLPVDMLNGVLLTNDISLPLSVSQILKMLLLFLMFISFIKYPKYLFYSVGLSIILLIPTFFQIIQFKGISLIFKDLIKISKYLIPVFSFFFFYIYLKKSPASLIFKLVYFSYFILIGNILIKHVGFGYPMYNYDDIGSKGFFYAGNEISALLLILSSIVSFKIWNRNKYLYVLTALLNVFVALTISSKTSLFGIVLIHVLIPIKRPSLRKLNLKLFLNTFIIILIALIPLSYFSWSYIKATNIFNRISYFYEKFDFLTFMLSNRNVFLENSSIVYWDQYNFIEKIIGVGQSTYEQLNENKLVEIDIADIFFAYAFLGLSIFIICYLFIATQTYILSKNSDKYPYANLVLLMLILLFFISSTAGHVFSSGMAGVFIGLLFSLIYIVKPNYKNEV
jgi:hypothetical protein